MKNKFHVTLLQHSEGVSVSCPELPGCHSQGATMAEALENIRDAIQGYLELYGAPELRCYPHLRSRGAGSDNGCDH